MIIIKMNGGLGNQLQQYALYEKMRSLGKEVKLDISWFYREVGKSSKRDLELNYFPGVTYEVSKEEEISGIVGNRNIIKKIGEKLHLMSSPFYVESQMYDENLFNLDDKILEGYWACEAYYADILKELQKKLEFPEVKNPKNIRMKEKMEQTNSVCVHIRRGDYLTEENQRMFGGICTEEYYDAAIRYMKEQIEDVRFYIFSDDMTYVRQRYEDKGFTFVDINHGKDSFWDIYLMSCCKHNICANSTFSFWGARLNQNEKKIVVRPLKQKNCDWYVPEKMKQLWKGWTLIDENGVLC